WPALAPRLAPGPHPPRHRRRAALGSTALPLHGALMRLVRQLGSCGTLAIFGPLLWLAACAGARALGQHSYDVNITPWTKGYRVAETGVALPMGAARVTDPRVRAELDKYAKIWGLEPGACAEFPNAVRLPFSLNPFKASALLLRLKQKQAF